MASKRRAERAEYWADRFVQAETDPDEARALLKLFAELAEDAAGADPLLVQWVAQRVKTWTEAGFVREEASRAFGTRKAAHAPTSARAAEKRAQAIAEVHRLNRLEGMSLPDAFVSAGKLVSLTAGQVRDHYEAFRKTWREGGEVTDWMPVLMRLPAKERSSAVGEGRVGRQPKKKPAR